MKYRSPENKLRLGVAPLLINELPCYSEQRKSSSANDAFFQRRIKGRQAEYKEGHRENFAPRRRKDVLSLLSSEPLLRAKRTPSLYVPRTPQTSVPGIRKRKPEIRKQHLLATRSHRGSFRQTENSRKRDKGKGERRMHSFTMRKLTSLASASHFCLVQHQIRLFRQQFAPTLYHLLQNLSLGLFFIPCS